MAVSYLHITPKVGESYTTSVDVAVHSQGISSGLMAQSSAVNSV